MLTTHQPAVTATKLTKLVAVLAVRDPIASSKFYTDKLGFAVDHADQDWIMLERDAARIHLGNCPDESEAWNTGLHNWFGTILVNDIHALEQEFTGNGVEFLHPLEDLGDWISFTVQTPDGHRLVFGHLPSVARAA